MAAIFLVALIFSWCELRSYTEHIFASLVQEIMDIRYPKFYHCFKSEAIIIFSLYVNSLIHYGCSFIQLDLGNLKVGNEFSWHGDPENDPSAVHLDILDAEVKLIT